MIKSASEKLSISRQCQLLLVSRSSCYYKPRGESFENLELMKKIDEIYLKHQFYGSRQMSLHLKREGSFASRHKVRRLMRIMGTSAIYQKPNTSKKNNQHKVYRYLLKDKIINKANEVWCSDITYIPMNRGFMYLVVVMDWASRKVLSWRVSNTLDTSFCLDVLEEAIYLYGNPDIFNTNQGSQFSAPWKGAIF